MEGKHNAVAGPSPESPTFTCFGLAGVLQRNIGGCVDTLLPGRDRDTHFGLIVVMRRAGGVLQRRRATKGQGIRRVEDAHDFPGRDRNVRYAPNDSHASGKGRCCNDPRQARLEEIFSGRQTAVTGS